MPDQNEPKRTQNPTLKDIGFMLGELHSDVRNIKETLKEVPGLFVRVDRLERWVSSRKWVEGVIVTSILGLLVALISQVV